MRNLYNSNQNSLECVGGLIVTRRLKAVNLKTRRKVPKVTREC